MYLNKCALWPYVLNYGSNLLDSADLEATPAAEGHSVEFVRADDENYCIPVEENGTAVIELHRQEEQTIQRVVMKGQIRLSQRVEVFAIDVWTNGTWQMVYSGTVIGHKRIVVLEGVCTTALRIRILDARVMPTMKFIGVYA